jgi:hypothetical protein
MVHGQASLRHDFFQVTIGERVSQIPANAEEDDHVFEVPPAEQCWPFSGHDIPYQIRSITFATEPIGESESVYRALAAQIEALVMRLILDVRET